MNNDQTIQAIVLAVTAAVLVAVFVLLAVWGPVRDVSHFGGSSVLRPVPSAPAPQIGEPLVIERD